MIKSSKTYDQMADYLEYLANDLEWFTRNVNANITMEARRVYTKQTHFNGLPLCVEGWVALTDDCENCSVWEGQRLIARGLGIEIPKDEGIPPGKNVKQFFEENPEIWGNNIGDDMFFEAEAYREDRDDNTRVNDDNITMEDVIHKLRCVATRLRNNKK